MLRRRKSPVVPEGLPLPQWPEDLPADIRVQLEAAYASPVRAQCGHLTAIKGIVRLDDEYTVTDMENFNPPDFCLDCISAMAIRCGVCGKAIFIGDPIVPYNLSRPHTDLPEGSVVYGDPPTLVGCLGWNCASSGVDRGGFWLPDPDHPGHGRVQPVPSLLEQAAREGVACSNDLSRP